MTLTGRTHPLLLLVYDREHLARLRYEWDTLAAVAARAGFAVVVTHWHALSAGEGHVEASRAFHRAPYDAATAEVTGVRLVPSVIWTPWGVDGWFWDTFLAIAAGCHHTESPLLSEIDDKCALERCLREYERATGVRVSRPATLLSDERVRGSALEGAERVIVKPARGGKCEGIEIVGPEALEAYLAEAARGERPPFVAQRLVEDVPLLDGRRWDVRHHAGAVSLVPLRCSGHREAIVRLAAAPDGHGLEGWLTGGTFRERSGLGVRDTTAGAMLREVEALHGPVEGFWDQVEEIVRHVFGSIALRAERRPDRFRRTLCFAAFDLILERTAEGAEVRLLEINSHPGMFEWDPALTPPVLPVFHRWFRDVAAALPVPVPA